MTDPAEGWRKFMMEASASGSLTPAPLIEVVAPTPLSVGFSSPQFDPLEWLPPAAQEKLRALRLRSADSHAVIPTGFDVQSASAERVAAANALKRLVSHPQDGGFGLKPDNRQVVAAQRTLDKATDDFERIKQRSEAKTAAWQAASGALANVETWLKHGKPPGVQLLDYDGPEPTLAKGEASVIDAIENRRRRVRELRADLHRIASAPYPSSYAKQRMRAQIEALAMQGAPSISRLIELDGPIDFQTQSLRSEVLGADQRALAFAELPSALALICWLHKDALIVALDGEIASESDDKAALSAEARQKAEAEVQDDLLAVERDESWFVWSAQGSGLPVEHRSDCCSPLAILQVRMVTAARADLPPTSPEHAYNVIGGRR
ncbi:hypothetical protein [Bradyrhizobium sp. CSS354]|uniref:hypothetical protein n=1 Tax=Bradyrhizobium sp. CSS354 TaxID=2699172 RepID=UPI0023AEA496|nr:hypothetical protein [Bradyrhizobium sp. CSS354]MDE5465223.1 hypothetical protein [Bradyrhizobium sp. CSS354]